MYTVWGGNYLPVWPTIDMAQTGRLTHRMALKLGGNEKCPAPGGGPALKFCFLESGRAAPAKTVFYISCLAAWRHGLRRNANSYVDSIPWWTKLGAN